AKKTYLKRYPYAVLMKTTLRAVQLKSIKLTDNRLGFGRKLLWPPPKPPKPSPKPPKPPKPSPKPPFKNIIFDLGGVLMQIDFTLTFHAFEQLVAQNPEHAERRKFSAQLLFQDPAVKQILEGFETGKITEQVFRTGIMAASGLTVSDEEFDAAWNALLMYYPEDYIPLVQQLRKNYRVFLLSNTNSIHRRYFNHKLKEQFGIESMDHLMDQAFYSFELGFRKPDPRIYQKMQEQTGISFEETLFLDDLEDNIISARQAGMQTVWINDTKTITDVFITG
ncbi:MAG: HAD-IA family hydrolase, partial [Bacteroidales bacterium]|nr:HAD-IA family hydrolase [Bacteroidales bacterium]